MSLLYHSSGWKDSVGNRDRNAWSPLWRLPSRNSRQGGVRKLPEYQQADSFQCYHSNSPQCELLTTAELCCLGSQKLDIKASQSWLLLEARREGLPASSSFWGSLVCGCTAPIPASIFPGRLLCCPNLLFLSLTKTPVLDLGPILNPGRFHH